MKKRILWHLYTVILVSAIVLLVYSLLNMNKLINIDIADYSSISEVISGASYVLGTNEIYFDSDKFSQPVSNENEAVELLNKIGFVDEDYCYGDTFINELNNVYCYNQHKNGVPVIGSVTKVITDKNGKVLNVISNFVNLDDFSTLPRISDEMTAQIIQRYLSETYNLDTNSMSIHVELSILIGESSPRLVYYVNVNNGIAFFVAADTGEIMEIFNIFNYVDVNMKGQLGDVTIPLLDDIGEQRYIFEDTSKRIKAYEAINKTISLTVPDYNPLSVEYANTSTSAYMSCVDAYYNVHRVYAFYDSILGHKSTDKNGEANIYIIDGINSYFGKDGEKDFRNNAGSCSAEQDGDKNTIIVISEPTTSKTFACDLDIIAHEYTHAVEFWLVNGNYTSKQGNGINEAIADILGECCQAYCDNSDIDWRIGSVRDIANATNDTQQLTQYKKIKDDIDGHDSSTILSYAAYMMSEGVCGGSINNNETLQYDEGYKISDYKTISKLWYNSLFYLTPSADFISCRFAVENAANVMFNNGQLSEEQRECVSKAFDAVGVPTFGKIGSNTNIEVFNAIGDKCDSYHVTLIDEGVFGVLGDSKTIIDEDMDNYTFNLYKIKPYHNYTLFVSDLRDITNSKTVTFFAYSKGDERVLLETSFTPFSGTRAEEYGILSGKVCSAADKTTPIVNAQIAVYYDGVAYSLLQTDDNGQYSAKLPVGEHSVEISADGYISFTSTEKINADETTYSETYLMIVDNGNVNGSAIGTIYNALSGETVPNVKLDIHNNWNNTTGELVDTVYSGNSGIYSITLPVGNYTLIASYNGFVSTSANIVVQTESLFNQDITISPFISDDTFRIVLEWGANPRDLDSHIKGVLQDGNTFHTYYNNMSCNENGISICRLDHDDTKGNGFETITLVPNNSTPYSYYVHKYAGDGEIATSGAQVRIYQGSNTMPIATFNAPVDQEAGDYWNLATIQNGEVSVINKIVETEPNLPYYSSNYRGNEPSDNTYITTDISENPYNIPITSFGNDIDYSSNAFFALNSFDNKLIYSRGKWVKDSVTIPIEINKALIDSETGMIQIIFNDLIDNYIDVPDVYVYGLDITLPEMFSLSENNTNERTRMVAYNTPQLIHDLNVPYKFDLDVYVNKDLIPNAYKRTYKVTIKAYTSAGEILHDYEIEICNDAMKPVYDENTSNSERKNNTNNVISKNTYKSKYTNKLDKALKKMDNLDGINARVEGKVSGRKFKDYFVNDSQYQIVMDTVAVWECLMDSDIYVLSDDYNSRNNSLCIENVKMNCFSSPTQKKGKSVPADIYFIYNKYVEPAKLKTFLSIYFDDIEGLNEFFDSSSFSSVTCIIDYHGGDKTDVRALLSVSASSGNLKKAYNSMSDCLRKEYIDQILDFCKGVCEEEIENIFSETVLYSLMKYYIDFKDTKDFYDAADKVLKASAVYITYKDASW